MVYVKHFDILGIETAQIPCVELQGPPTSATEGAVGVLGMDVTSDGREVYLCTAVNGAIYTWQPLKDGKDGTCVIKSEINDNGELILTLSNGNTLNAGVVKGADGKDGKDGKDGANGTSVTNTQLNGNGELIITLSDGTTKNVGVVVGDKGEQGVSVVKAEINASYELIITLSNDTVMNLGSIKSDYVAEADHAVSADNAGTVNNHTVTKDANGLLYIDGTLVSSGLLVYSTATSIDGLTKISWSNTKEYRELLVNATGWFDIGPSSVNYEFTFSIYRSFINKTRDTSPIVSLSPFYLADALYQDNGIYRLNFRPVSSDAEVYIGGIDRSSDGGKTWTALTGVTVNKIYKRF